MPISKNNRITSRGNHKERVRTHDKYLEEKFPHLFDLNYVKKEAAPTVGPQGIRMVAAEPEPEVMAGLESDAEGNDIIPEVVNIEGPSGIKVLKFNKEVSDRKVEEVVNSYQEQYKLDTDQQIFFHEQDFYVLSNFSAFRLNWKGLSFDTSEAAYHWEKFIDPKIKSKILYSTSAHQAFKIAEENRELVREYWKDIKLVVMKDILHAKADQHEYVRRKLLSTGNRELIEDSWRDNFWGWGPSKDGLNMLGHLWMEVREELRAKSKG